MMVLATGQSGLQQNSMDWPAFLHDGKTGLPKLDNNVRAHPCWWECCSGR